MVDAGLVSQTLKTLGTVFWEGKEYNLYDGYEREIVSFIDDYLKKYTTMEFKGAPHLAESQSHVVLDNAHQGFWKDSNITDWLFTPTGLNVFNDVFPEAVDTRIRVDTHVAPHWAYLLGFVEIGSANNLVRIEFRDVNGKKRPRLTSMLQSRLGELKIIRLKPGLRLEDRGTIDINAEYENASATELMPLALHLIPFEIATGDISEYVTGVAY